MDDRRYLFSGLKNAPRELVRILSEIPDELEETPLEGGEWSAHQIISHLCHVNTQVYLPRLQQMLERSNPLFADFDPEAWMAARYDASVPVHELVSEFKAQCDEMADRLEALADEDWDRPGTHPTLGTHAIEWWADRLVAHIGEHLAQLRGD